MIDTEAIAKIIEKLTRFCVVIRPITSPAESMWNRYEQSTNSILFVLGCLELLLPGRLLWW